MVQVHNSLFQEEQIAPRIVPSRPRESIALLLLEPSHDRTRRVLIQGHPPLCLLYDLLQPPAEQLLVRTYTGNTLPRNF
jgi:hypothetical protein